MRFLLVGAREIYCSCPSRWRVTPASAALPYILYEVLALVLARPDAAGNGGGGTAVAGSAVPSFLDGIAFRLVGPWRPRRFRFLVNYGADVVEPDLSIERNLDFSAVLMVATALAFRCRWQLLLAAFR